MARYLLDTDVLIDYLRGIRPAVALLEGLYRDGHTLGVSCINIAELYSGLASEDRERASELIDAMNYLGISREAARLAGQYRYSFASEGIQLSTPDTLIAAVAVEHGAILATGNAAHYPMENLTVLPLSR